MPGDPFTKLYDAAVKELTARSEHLFRIISWNTTSNPQPDVATQADLPEWQLRPVGRRVQLGAKSCATTVQESLSLTNLSGSRILGKLFYPGEWALLRALYQLQYDAPLEQLQWEGRGYVDQVLVSSTTVGLTNPLETRQIDGWGSQWIIEVHMSFSPSDLGG